MEPDDEQGDRDQRDAPAKIPYAMSLPVTSSAVVIGEIRNSSNRPLVFSRTTDSAISVTAMCWRIRASTAGPKYWTTVGADWATFSTNGLGRRGDDVGRDLRRVGRALARSRSPRPRSRPAG